MRNRTRKMGPSCYVHENDVVTRMIYMAHPVGGDVELNIERAKAWLKHLEASNPWVVFVAQWITGVELWDDADPVQRAHGLKRCFAQVERCDELWLVGPRVSAGMYLEQLWAQQFGVAVVNFTGEGRELPPADGSGCEGRRFDVA